MEDHDQSYTLTIEERPGYLYARIKADTITREAAVRYLNEIGDKCAELKCTRLLLERDIPTMMSAPDVYFTAQDFVEMIRGVRVAIVNRYLPHEDALHFGAMVGNNRGANMQIHDSLESAKKWLMQ